ncbi:MAG: response regulator receiver modulated CheB methylesterase [Myxococcaceae bacterium]|nr:response regulator receiver modulated CheB methylesterase [Myxococcaceae bacterium]
MTNPVRVLIVDDSSTVRRLLTLALSAYPEIEVVGTAANGIIALKKLSQLELDAVILDVEMPEMDGITTLIYLREARPRLPVVMFSALTERGANVTFDALAAGASDYVLKPSAQDGETLEGVVANALVPKLLGLTRSPFGVALQEAMASLPPERALDRKLTPVRLTGRPSLPNRPSLISPTLLSAPAGLAPKLRPSATPTLRVPATVPLGKPLATELALSIRHEAGASRPSAPTAMVAPQQQTLRPMERASLARHPVGIIVIAASTGGPNALADLLPRLPAGLPVPIVVVQHMPALFTRCLAERLATRTELRVLESAGQELLLPGTVYIAPGNRHLEVVRDALGVRTLVTDGPAENSCRPAADVLFRSVARAYGGAVLCVVLTGMGQDGARGAREIVNAGGRVLVQSGPTCVIWGMPKAIEEAGLAEAVVPLSEMAAAILQRVGVGLSPRPLPEGPP